MTAAPPAARPYHHGNLREALVAAGTEIAREGGPDAVALREVARRAGVSHNAAYRHFSDRGDLLDEVAARAFADLARAMERALDGVRGPHRSRARRRLSAVGGAYVRWAVAEPGWFRTAFTTAHHPERVPSPSPGAGDSGLNPYALLGRALDDLVAAGELDPRRRPGAEVICWSAVHGLADLLTSGPLRAVRGRELDGVLADLLERVEHGLTAA